MSRYIFLIVLFFSLFLGGCVYTDVSYFNAIESGSKKNQYFVSIVKDTFQGQHMIKRQSYIVEYKEESDGSWTYVRTVVDGIKVK